MSARDVRESGVTRFKPYPEYKASGVEWLGEIPVLWEVRKVKRLALVRRGASPRPIDDPIYFDEEGEYAWVRIADVTASERYLERTTQRLSALGKSKSVALEPGELFLSIAATVGKPVITRVKCCIHDGFVYFVGLCEDREYLYYLFSCGEPYKGLGKLGTQLNLNTDTIGDICLPLPSRLEQRAIVQFLDQETAKIDALVANKERLIELLQEKRAALITQAVTKGLDPNVPMKDSGVEWLGEIPAHWTAKHLRWAIMFQRGHDLPTDEREDGQVPVVSSSGISSMHSRAVAKAPGIVTGRYGTIGHFHLITQDYWPLNTTLYSIDLRGNDPRFLRYMLTHLSPLFLLNAVKSAVPGVDRNDIHPTRTAVPPLLEQRAIADFLDAKSAESDGLARPSQANRDRGSLDRAFQA